MSFEIVPPEWVTPWTGEPSTGWLSPEGVLFACAPWRHAELAGELTRSSGGGGGARLYSLGWLQIGRKSASVRVATGGVFYVRGPLLAAAQAALLLAWIEAGTEVVDLTGVADARYTLEP